MIPASERAKTVHALDRLATVSGKMDIKKPINKPVGLHYQNDVDFSGFENLHPYAHLPLTSPTTTAAQPGSISALTCK
jgi:hypothetical protein